MSNYRIEDRLKAMGYDPSTLEENDKIAIATDLNYLHDEYIEEIAENSWYVPGGVINVYDDNYVPVTSIIINGEIPKLNVGDTYTINATVKPDNASFKQLLYNAGDASIVTIDKKGKITSKAIGTTTITVISDDNEAITAETEVEVKIGVTSVTVSGAELVKTGTPQQLSVTVEPEDAKYKEVTWASSDENVATVDNTGLVTAIAGGNVTITATSTDNPSVSDTHNMTSEVSVTGLTLDKNSLNIDLNDSTPQTITATVEPSDATDKSLTWESSDTSVVTVDNGVVTGVGDGDATITVTSNDNPEISATCSVNVKRGVLSVTIDDKQSPLEVGHTYNLSATVEPNNVTDKTVTWSSSNPSVATINNNGEVNVISAGKTNITVKSVDNTNATDSYEVITKVSVTGVTVSGSNLVKTGNPQQLSVTVEPEEATYKEVTWTSSDPDVATVDDTGLVTAISEGNVTITATSTDNPSAKGTHNMTAEVSVTGLTLDKNNLNIDLNDSTQQIITATVLPNNATHKDVTWSSSDTSVATVNNGVVTGVGDGDATITVTSNDNPEISATCSVNVKRGVLSVDIQEESVEINAGETTQLHVTVLPENATDKTVTWSSSNTSIATVDNTGLVTGVGDGEVTITVKSNDNDSKTDTCTITSKVDSSQKYFTTVITTGGNITWTGTAPIGTSNINTLSYSTDNGATWSTASGNITLTVEADDKVLWKGITTPIADDYYKIHGIGKFGGDTDVRYSVEGNAMSLLYEDDFKGQTSLQDKRYALSYLFNGNTNVTSAENLSLPATTLANYCYANMFQSCTRLTTAPSVLPATTLTTLCYNSMFYGCTSLTIAPELPATSLANSCYEQMFLGCTNLTTAPELPATTLANYCYSNMFEGCTSLNSITCLATNIGASNCTKNWVNGVAASGTFTKNASMTKWTTGNNGIPSGWDVQDA